MEQLLAEAAVRVGQLEGPQEVVGLLEVGPHGVNLVDQVLHADDAELSQGAFDHRVVRDRDALLVHLTEAALVDQLAYGLEVGVTVRHVRLHQAEHLHSRGVQPHEHRVVDLAQTKELQNLAHLGGHADDTADADNKHHVGLSRHMDVACGLSLAAEADGVILLCAVLLDVTLRTLEDLGLLGPGDL